MTGEEDGTRHGADYRTLPPRVRLDDTIESVDPHALPDPEAGRNGDHHRALRDD